MGYERLLLLAIVALSIQLSQSASCSANRVSYQQTQLDSHIDQVFEIAHGPVIVVTTKSMWAYRDGRWVNLEQALNRAKGSAYTGPLKLHYTTPHVMYVRTASGKDLWLTEDMGLTFKYVTLPSEIFGIEQLQLHETDKGRVLLRSETSQCSSGLWECRYDLYLAKDGVTFKSIRTNVGYAAWGKKDKIFTLDVTDKTKSLMEANMDLSSTSDDGDEWRAIKTHCIGYIIINDILLAVQEINEQYSLHISRDRGDQPFQMAKIPVALPQNGYTIISADNDEIMMHVNHGRDSYGNLYVSNAQLSDFVLSLRNNKRNAKAHADVLKLSQIPGFIMANQVSPSPYDQEDATVTRISFNRGGDWQSISAPSTDVFGRKVECVGHSNGDGCKLNLFGPTDMEVYGRMTSPKNALGIVIGTGTVGTEVENTVDSSKIGTYLSIDAGVSWRHIFPFSTTATTTNHGSLMLAMNNIEATTKTLHYSWSSGKSWDNCTVDDGIRVHSIYGLGNATDPMFLIRGEKSVGGSSTGVVAIADFKELHPRECGADDYEDWTVKTDVAECIMGAKYTYNRKKPDAQCWIPRDEKQDTRVTPCPCTIFDYECDYCHERAATSAICVEVCESNVNPPEDCEGTYEVTKGYRLIPGDVCDVTSGLNMLPDRIPCPKKGGVPGWVTAFLIFFAIFGTVAFFVAMFILFRRNERFNHFIVSLTSRLPKRIVDPFRSVQFVRIDQDEDTRSGLLLDND